METDFSTDEQMENTEQRSSCLFPPESSHFVQTTEEPSADILYEQQRKAEDQICLLEALARIEQDLKESIRREEKRQQELNQVRQEENRIRWRSLSFLSLNQRTAKPWVTSYYKNIPMHIYCLPIETVIRRQNKKRTKR
ncbi:uncharacterized protein LOC143710699 [Siphateles boraxobius]|uniref:uncharacterized protein LOC143710699 n=1 Tax=Siphateles boraxobius TaxID=180520 RepID=UPI004062A048